MSFSCLRHIPVPQTPLDLMYRGVSSYKEREADLASLSATQPVTTIAVKISSTYQNRKKVVDEEASRIHISNIRRSLEHRLKVAKARGDKHLLNLLEAEFKQMALHA